jgi:hypothetical protein
MNLKMMHKLVDQLPPGWSFLRIGENGEFGQGDLFLRDPNGEERKAMLLCQRHPDRLFSRRPLEFPPPDSYPAPHYDHTILAQAQGKTHWWTLLAGPDAATRATFEKWQPRPGECPRCGASVYDALCLNCGEAD